MSSKTIVVAPIDLMGNVLRDKARGVGTASHVENEEPAPRSNHTVTPDTGRVNDAISANLSAAFPKTPQRATPNSTRKRRHVPDLSRPTVTPSHGVSMSMIFRDASATLQGFSTPPGRPTSNTKRSRLPVSQTRSVRFGSFSIDGTAVSSTENLSHMCRGRELSLGTISNSRKALPTSTLPNDELCQTPTTATNADRIAHDLMTDRQGQLSTLFSSDTHTPDNVSRRSNDGYEAKEPISSGFATPIALSRQPPMTPEEVKYPQVECWQLPQSRSRSPCSGSDGNESDQSWNVHVTLPASTSDTEEYQATYIQAWLRGMPGLMENSPPSVGQKQGVEQSGSAMGAVALSPRTDHANPTRKTAQNTSSKQRASLHYPSRALSNKENASPPKHSPQPICPPSHYLTSTPTPSRSQTPNIHPTPQSASVLSFAHQLTPRGGLSLPPKRKKTQIGIESKPIPPNSSKDFTIHDDQLTDALAQLSPDVERKRKGKRPKRERCMSYWDEDILQSGPCLPTGGDRDKAVRIVRKNVLGESQQSTELTKEKPFLEEAESAAFVFRA